MHARTVEVPALRYVPIPGKVTDPVRVTPIPARIDNAYLDGRISELTRALSWANVKLAVAACLSDAAPDAASSVACLKALDGSP